MTPARLKTCPDCGTLAAIDDTSCADCGHAYRTRFASPPSGPAFVALPPLPPPPVPRPSAGAGISPPLEWSDGYAAGRKRMKWVWAVGGIIVFFKVVSIVAPLVMVAVAAHWGRTVASP